MEKIRVSAIAAIGVNQELGKKNGLIWKLDADFTRMKELIGGHALIMGRKTYESIGREIATSPSIVITRNENYTSPYPNADNTFVVGSLAEALTKAKELELTTPSSEKEIFIFGGAQIYEEALLDTDRLYLTNIDKEDSEADSFFCNYDEFTNIIEESNHTEKGIDFRFVTLERQ